MDEQDIRDRAEALCAALIAGDIELATAAFSDELRRNLGEVIALLPLPASEATVDSIERSGGGSSITAILRIVGETEEAEVLTRWKDRDGTPTVIEASHLSRKETAPAQGDGDEGGAADESSS